MLSTIPQPLFQSFLARDVSTRDITSLVNRHFPEVCLIYSVWEDGFHIARLADRPVITPGRCWTRPKTNRGRARFEIAMRAVEWLVEEPDDWHKDALCNFYALSPVIGGRRVMCLMPLTYE